MTALIVAGLAIVGTVLFTIARLSIRRWLGYANILELVFTIGMIYMLHATFSGIIAAAFAGIIMSVMLQVLRKTMGVERYKIERVSWRRGFIRAGWYYIPASELRWFNARTINAEATA